MTLTNAQMKSLKEVADYSFIDEEQSFTEHMADEGWADDEIETFTRLSTDDKIAFMRKHNNLTRHIYFHLLILKTIQ